MLNKQHTAIVTYLKKHRELTTLGAAYKLKQTKLPTRIGELRRKGYVIPGRWIKTQGARCMAYWLDQKRSKACA